MFHTPLRTARAAHPPLKGGLLATEVGRMFPWSEASFTPLTLYISMFRGVQQSSHLPINVQTCSEAFVLLTAPRCKE